MSFFRRPLLGPAERLVAHGLGLLALVVYAAAFVGPAELSDSEVEFQSTSSFVRTGSLALGGTPEAERIRAAALADPDLAEELGVRVVDTGDAVEVYGRHGIAQVLVAAPFYALGRLWAELAPELEAEGQRRAYDGVAASESLAHLVVGLRNPLFGAGTVWIVAMCALRLGVARGRAALAAAGLAFTTYLWPQARSSLSDVQATFFLALALHLVLVARERLDRLEMPRGRIAFGIGAALALAFLSRIGVALACAFVAAVGEVVLRVGTERIAASRWTPRGPVGVTPRRLLVLAVLPLALGFAAFLGTNVLRYGVPFDSGYGSPLRGGIFDGQILSGALGLLISPGRGLLVHAPLLLLVPIGLARALREGERLIVLAVLGVAALVGIPAALLDDWHGAATYGPRYVLPALPYLWLFVALALDEALRRPWVVRVAQALAVAGAIVAFGGVAVDHSTHDELARSAARVAWPDAPSLGLPLSASGAELEVERYERTLSDLRFIAPLAHWRILRHRVAGLGESFPMREIFLTGPEGLELTPARERGQAFRHFGWREFVRRFEGPSAAPVALGAVLLLLAAIALVRGMHESV